jgi:thiol-disulfide isomerase/thioredoxin
MFVLVMLAAQWAQAGEFIIRLDAGAHAGKVVVLSRYDDLFTLRTVRLAQELAQERVVFHGQVEGTQKMQLRIGELIGDVYVRPGSELHVRFPEADPRVARSLNTSTRVGLEFTEISFMDINALVSDLNGRVDDFVTEGLATDASAGMQAVEKVRSGGTATATDSTRRPPTLFVDPRWSRQRVDSFATKLQRFYAEVQDPWFTNYLAYSIAGLKLGPRRNDRLLWEQHLKERPVQHDNPEYVRFVKSFFEGQLVVFALVHERQLASAMAAKNVDSLHAVFSRSDFLRDDAVLRELVLIEQLYEDYQQHHVDREAARTMLAQVSERSAVAEHRKIAANMLWDLTAMRPGSALPAMLLQDLQGRPVEMEELMEGPLVIAVTASWCTYCQLEIQSLERLAEEYSELIPIVAISLDENSNELKRYLQGRARKIRWLHAEAEQRLRDDLRIRALPAFYILQDGVLTHSPAPLPSNGMAEIFHRAKVQRERDGRIKVWDD